MTEDPQPDQNGLRRRPRPSHGKTAKTGQGNAEPESYRERDVAVDTWGITWPDPPAPVARSTADRVRLDMVARPGEVVVLAWRYRDAARAARIAASFRKASNKRLDEQRLGTDIQGHFETRHYWDPDTKTYRIAARYLPDHPSTSELD